MTTFNEPEFEVYWEDEKGNQREIILCKYHKKTTDLLFETSSRELRPANRKGLECDFCLH